VVLLDIRMPTATASRPWAEIKLDKPELPI
jgi:hypothetical protein